MDKNKQKKVDNFLNPFFKIFHFVIYLIIVPLLAVACIYGDLLALNFVSINFNDLSLFNGVNLKNLILFYLITCIPIIGVDLLISIFVKKKNKEDISSYEIIYDFIYEMIDNIFKCLSFAGILFQVYKNINELTQISVPLAEKQSKVVIIIIFGLVIGVQQFILKCWFKTVRKFEDENFIQNVNNLIMLFKSKNKVKKNINNFEKILNIKRGKRDKKDMEQILTDIFEVLDNNEIKEIFNKYNKTKPIVEIIDSKELQECKKNFKNSKDKSGINVTKIEKELTKIKNYL